MQEENPVLQNKGKSSQIHMLLLFQNQQKTSS